MCPQNVKIANENEIIVAGRNVIRVEINGLEMLAKSLDSSFIEAVDAMLITKGRVVITGVGKSAHVARKMAATLASTGTPAYFVHATEASHGDLGMIIEDDIVIALSNSGETRELSDLIEYCTRFSITLIAMTANRNSVLGSAASICLTTPKSQEACQETSAPTTSTTIMMALGDALAIALLEKRGFKSNDFKKFHPGGSLGAALMKVSDVMHFGDSLPVLPDSSQMADALIEMTSKGFGCTGIIDDNGKLIGVITDGDLRRHMGKGLVEASVKNVMTMSPMTIGPASLLSEALRTMTVKEHKITAIFVVENDKPIGIVHMHDCLRAGVA